MSKENLEILKQVAVADTSNWKEEYDWRRQNKDWLESSAKIALLILKTLRSRGISQKSFAAMLGISTQSVSKLLKGQENFTLQTLHKIQSTLSITLIAIGEIKPERIVEVQYQTVVQVIKFPVFDYSRNIADLSSGRPVLSTRNTLPYDQTIKTNTINQIIGVKVEAQ